MLSKIKLFDELPNDYLYHLNLNIMKPIQLLFLSLIFIFSSCITIETTSSGFKDEIISTHSFNANRKIAVVDFARHQRLRKALKM